MQESCSEAAPRERVELLTGRVHDAPVERKISRVKSYVPWSKWPSIEKAEIPVLTEHPCYDSTYGLEREDTSWKISLAFSVERGRKVLPSNLKNRKEILKAVDSVILRSYHVARMLQTYFENPVHDNFKDPFLETIYIMLSWRTRIPDARAMLIKIMTTFKDPRNLTRDNALPRLRKILGSSGFTEKRPMMVIELVKKFIERFPDGDTTVMTSWKDDEIIEFLTGIPGIGRKSAICVMMYSLGRLRFPIDTHASRVLKRTEILRELIAIDENANQKTIQVSAEFAVPPSVRGALHTGFISIGKEFCRSGKPSCGKCPISSECQYNTAILVKKTEGSPYTHVDLFCGAGGFAEGFRREGFRTILAVDNERAACDTFRLNHPEVPRGNILCEDLASRQVKTIIRNCSSWNNYLKPGKVDVLSAGIPCQGFSKAGYRSRPRIKYDPLEDPRNLLYKRVILWVRDLKPRYVVLENVPEIRSAGAKDAKILNSIFRSLKRMGYRVDHGIINAFNHGTPQIRLRMIILASHRSVPEIKVEEVERYSKKGTNVRKAISQLPQLESDDGSWYLRTEDGILTSHVSRFNNEEDLRIFDAILPGEHYDRFIVRRKDIMDERRKNKKHAVYRIGSFSDKYHRLNPDNPSRTIVAHLKRDGNGYIHPCQIRSISIREALRLQGFRDDFILCGSGSKQYIQVGNAVPPPLARDIARAIAHNLKEGRRRAYNR